MVWGEVVDGVREEEGVEDEKVDRAWGLGIGTGQGLRRESGQGLGRESGQGLGRESGQGLRRGNGQGLHGERK